MDIVFSEGGDGGHELSVNVYGRFDDLVEAGQVFVVFDVEKGDGCCLFAPGAILFYVLIFVSICLVAYDYDLVKEVAFAVTLVAPEVIAGFILGAFLTWADYEITRRGGIGDPVLSSHPSDNDHLPFWQLLI